MFPRYFLLFIICTTPFTLPYTWRFLYKKSLGSTPRFYVSCILFSISIVAVLYAIDKASFISINALRNFKALHAPDWIVNGILIAFALPVVFEIGSFFRRARRDVNKIVFKGKIFPAYLLPQKTGFELILFCLFTLANVVLEEVLYRQLLFNISITIWNLTPALTILFSSVVFSLVHGYKQVKEFFIYFFIGIAFGVFFYDCSGNIWAVVSLHFLLNLTEVVIAYKLIRVRDLNDVHFKN